MEISKQKTVSMTVANLAHRAQGLHQRSHQSAAPRRENTGSRRHIPNHRYRRLQRRLTAMAFLFGGVLLLALLVAQAPFRGQEAPHKGVTGSVVVPGAVGDSHGATGLQGAIQGSQTDLPPTPVMPTSTVPTASPAPGVVLNPAGGNGALFDPKQWVIDALSAAFAWIVDGVTSTVTNLLQQAFALDILVLTPPTDTYQNTVVLAFWRTVVAIADSALAIIVCWAGYTALSVRQLACATTRCDKSCPGWRWPHLRST
jgi:hypothetical protein